MRIRVLSLILLVAWSAFGAEPAKPKLVPEAAPASAIVPTSEPATKTEPDGITTKWWFWTAIGVIAVGAFAGAAVVVGSPRPRNTTQPDGDFR